MLATLTLWVPHPSVQAAPTAISGLHVQGNQILDSTGKPIRLLGVNRSGAEFKCIQGGSASHLGWGIFDGPTDLASAQAIAAWHVNVVRLPLNEDCWLGINGVNPTYGGAAYQAAIQGYVRTLHQAGLYVILDLHWNAPGTAPAAAQQPMPDQDHAPSFWHSVATTFAGDPAVAFDLYNEPFLYGSYLQNAGQDPWACWLNGCGLTQYLTGGTPYTQAFNWQAVGMQSLVNTIRATGATNLILVGGLDWANDLSGWLAHAPVDPAHNLAASWHSYPGQGCSAQTCWNSVVAPLAQHVPIVVGETGDNVCTPATYDPAFLPWADQHGLSYLGWTWNTWQDCQNVLITNYNGTPTSNYGQYVQSHLAALSGVTTLPTPIGTPPATTTTSVPPTTPSTEKRAPASPTATLTPQATAVPVATCLLREDSFVRADRSDGWGTASDGSTWIPLSDAAPPLGLGITGNKGIIRPSATSVYNVLGPALASADQEGLVRWSVGSPSATAGILLRAQDRANFDLARYSGTNTIQFYKKVAGREEVATAFAFTPVSGALYWLRFRVQGPTIAIKVWADGTAEPGQWGFTTTDSAVRGPGSAGLYGYASMNSTNTFDSFSVTDPSRTCAVT